MANIKITDLNAIADPISTDVLPIVDVSADTTNKISIEQLLRNAAAGTAALPAFAFDDDPDTGIYRTGADGLGFSTGGTGRLFINSSGRVGVGATNPQARLHVAESGGATISLQDSSANNGVNYASIQADGTTALVLKASGGTTSKAIKFLSSTTAEAMRIDSSGRVGIGTPAPARLLDVNDSADFAVPNGEGLRLGYRGQTKVAYIGIDANDSYSATQSWANSCWIGFDSQASAKNILYRANTNHIFYGVNAAERMRIDSSGRVGIGTPSPLSELNIAGSNPSIYLQPDADTETSELAFRNAANTQTRGFISYSHSSDSMSFRVNLSERLKIDSSGRVAIGTPTPASSLKLHVDGNIGFNNNNGIYGKNSAGTSMRRLFHIGADNNVYINANPENNAVVIQSGVNSEAMRIDSSGRVGIGTPSPETRLHVRGTDNNFITLSHQTRTGKWFIEHSGVDSENLVFTQNNGTSTASSLVTGRDLHVWYTGNTERARIDSSGNVGIGTSAPIVNLDVHNTGTEDTALRLYNSGTGSSSDTTLRSQIAGTTASNYIYFGDGDDNDVGRIRYLHSNNSMTFRTNAVDALTIDSNQRVGIGTPSPGSILHIKGGGPLIIENSTSSAFGVEEFLRVDDGGGVFDRALQGFELRNGGSRSHAISHNLNITSNGSAYTYTQGNYSGSNLIEFTNGQIKIYADEQVTSGSQDAITPTEVVRIDSDGAVDILANDLTVYGLTVGRGGGADISNVAVGDNALASNTTGVSNTAIGNVALDANTTGNYNTAVGSYALSTAQTANSNTAVGVYALYLTNTGYENVAVGRDALYDNTTGYRNVAVGNKALANLTTGIQNTALGRNALANTTTGNNNTALGYAALVSNVAGSSGVAIGYESQYYCNNTSTTYGNTNVSVGFKALRGSTTAANNTGTNNVAIGYESLLTNSSGANNVAVGRSSLYSNTTGGGNVAIGHNALLNPSVGSYGVAIGYESQRYANDTTTAFTNTNVSIGFQALRGSTTPANNTGEYNTAIGYTALRDNTSGIRNVALGTQALLNNTSGDNNTAVGGFALDANTTGNNNVAVGVGALTAATTAAANTAVGVNAGLSITTGTTNTCIGRAAGDSLTTGSNNTVIGYDAAASSATVNNEITLGNSSIATLRCNATLQGLSDARDKTNIQPLGAGLQFVNALNPVSFDWNMRDGAKVGVADTGFIAQELQEAQDVTGTVIPGLVYDNNPEKLEASYGKLLPTLVKAIQELSAENAELKARLEAAGI